MTRRALLIVAALVVVVVLAPRPAAKVTPADEPNLAVGGQPVESKPSPLTPAPSPIATPSLEPRETGGIGQPASYCRQFCDTPEPRVVVSKGSVAGTSTWYSYVYGGAAAAQKLRDYLGPDWRGTVVRVCYRENCVRAVLLDYESSTIPGRLIDLDSRLFAQLAPLSVGAIEVTVAVVR